RRIVETPHSRLGLLVALLVFAGLTAAVTFSALHRFARPSIWQGILWPTLVFAIGLAIGGGLAASRLRRMSAARARSAPASELPGLAPLGRWWLGQPASRRALLVQSLRGGTASVALVTAFSAVLVTLLLGLGYGQVVALYEGIH